MNKLPDHIQAQLRRLIAEGLPAEQIAFMMRLSREIVDAEIRQGTDTVRAKEVTR